MEVNALANVAAGLTVVLGLYGSVIQSDPKPALIATVFTVTFFYALRRAQSKGNPAFQLVFALVLICISFALHLVYLPAGIGCFFTLMLCKNDLLVPQKKKAEHME